MILQEQRQIRIILVTDFRYMLSKKEKALMRRGFVRYNDNKKIGYGITRQASSDAGIGNGRYYFSAKNQPTCTICVMNDKERLFLVFRKSLLLNVVKKNKKPHNHKKNITATISTT
ncbi:hypothetical protein FGI04_16610 [Dickeya ananatis]|uniref:hypothetical protein n=1 Tax=Dickeya ananatis TaxID=3061286 RepID=UPI001CE692CA|nr:hypothetical protein FGI04_16610 [Dickeya zeae]